MYIPRALFVLGGSDNASVRSMLNDIEVKSDYRPRIASADASDILRTCSYQLIDYFHRPDVETSLVLKSSAFAAACAHAIVPIFPHSGTPILVEGDRLPGPFFIDSNGGNAPEAANRPKVAEDIYRWYQGHASSDQLVRGIADALGLLR